MILTRVFRAAQPKSLLDECNRESGRIYTQTIVEHWRIYRNKGIWLSPGVDEKYNDFLSPTTLHAHSRDAAQQAFAKAVKTTHALRKAGFVDAPCQNNITFNHRSTASASMAFNNDGVHVFTSTRLISNDGSKSITVPMARNV